MNIEAVGWVQSSRREPIDDGWDGVCATITLDGTRFGADALFGLSEFSHVEVLFVFDRVDPQMVETSARRPRNNPAWPLVGIFAQRGKARPNRIGLCTCQLLRVDGLTITVRGLDAIDGTPVLDIKPYLTQFAPRGEQRQPAWSNELMSSYWAGGEPAAGD